MADFIKINPTDNVIIALKDFLAGDTISIDQKELKIVNAIPKGHKIALISIDENENIIKYGTPIGHATQSILAGEHVHIQNIKTNLSGTSNYSFNQKLNELSKQQRNLTFEGYKRGNGKVGIRNELWIVPTVGCVNGQAQQIVDLFKSEVVPTDIDSIEVFKHSYGCSQLGDDHTNTQKALADIINHPNAGGVFVLGLGCENNQIDKLKTFIGDYDESRVKFLVAQDVEDEVETGLEIMKKIYEVMCNDERETIPISELNIGLKCGGSDGFSGITANPLVGVFSDFLVAQGGTTILTEVPEMFGAETVLMARAIKQLA
jgi:altronate hydrolase